MSLKAIKTKIRSVEKTHQVTKAMEAVSAVKMRKSQARALLGRPYAVHALSILKRVTASNAGAMHPMLRGRKEGSVGTRTLFVVVTSDKGLAGALSSGLIKEVMRAMREQKLTSEDVGFVTIGKKGFEYFSKRGFKIEHNILLREEAISIDALRELADRLTHFYTSESYDRVFVAYTHFGSTMSQKPVMRQIVPVVPAELEAIVHDIIPTRGKFAELGSQNGVSSNGTEYLFEPSAQTILDELVPFLLTVELYHAVLEAEASEHSARMVAMKNASDKAEEVAEMLTIEFNKARQTAITREVSEIVGGVEAMK